MPSRSFKSPSGFVITHVPKHDHGESKESKGKVSHKEDRIFVIHKHSTSHLHYDFRISVDGVLKSWAIPREPLIETSDEKMSGEEMSDKEMSDEEMSSEEMSDEEMSDEDETIENDLSKILNTLKSFNF